MSKQIIFSTLGLLVFALSLGGCDKTEVPTEPKQETQKYIYPAKYGCFDYQVTITSGPDSGKSWTGDLIMNPIEPSGFFRGALVTPDSTIRRTLTVTNPSKIIFPVTGQMYDEIFSWIFEMPNNQRIFGAGLALPKANILILSGVFVGPDRQDSGVWHGTNYPPFIRCPLPDCSPPCKLCP